MKLIRVFKSLADDTRLRILNLLLVEKSLCVCEIVDALRLPQYQISRHLATLKNAGLIDFKKDGTWAYYSLKADDSLNKMLFSFLRRYLKEEIFQYDRKNLELRLLLREKGKCIVGFVPEKKLSQMIKLKVEKSL